MNKELQLRRITPEGMPECHRLLDDAKKTGEISSATLSDFLESAQFTRAVPQKIKVSPATFRNRLEVGKLLDGLLENVPGEILQEIGVWAWLTLYYFDVVCPADANGKRKVGGRERYVPDFANFQRYYRHLLYGPFSICRAYRPNPESAMAVLCSPVDMPGDVVESLVSRQEIITCPSVMEAATALYVQHNGQYKPNARRKNKGGARRFAAVIRQFDLTYDLHEISVKRLLEILPPEFDEFQPS